MGARHLAWILAALLPLSAAAQSLPTSSASTNSSSTSQAGSVANNQPVQSITSNSTSPDRISTAPAIFAPAMSPTAPCMAIMSGGVSVVGFGLTLGGGLEDKECTRREFARVLAQMGHADAGLAMLCGNAEVRATSPQLCARSDYVSARSETYVGSEPPIMPPAAVRPSKPVAPAGPAVGQLGYDTNGNRMVYNGAAWVAEQQAAGVITQPYKPTEVLK
jgi:hypothetical protein